MPLIIVSSLFMLVATLWVPALLVLGGPVAVVYATCCIGLMNIKLPTFFKTGDYSYGIYLYGFPIQQTIVWATHDKLTLWENFFLSLLVSCGFAVLSWHVIEKRCLLLRKRIHAAPSALPGGLGVEASVGLSPVSRERVEE